MNPFMTVAFVGTVLLTTAAAAVSCHSNNKRNTMSGNMLILVYSPFPFAAQWCVCVIKEVNVDV